MPKYSVGSESFETKKEVTDRVSSLLSRYFNKDLPAGPDFDFTLALLKLHPKASDKIGTGIKRFWVDKNKGPSTSFYFERADGSRDDFSTAKCIRDMKQMPHQ